MKINKLIDFIVFFMTGAVFGNLIWHFRLKNPLLLRELLLDLQDGGTPFLDWFIGLSFFVMTIWMIYIVHLYLIKRKYNKNRRCE